MRTPNGQEFWKGAWPVALGCFCVACWATAADMGASPLPLPEYFLRAAAVLLFGFIAFTLGFVPAKLAKESSDKMTRVLYLLAGLGVNAGLIWYLFFK